MTAVPPRPSPADAQHDHGRLEPGGRPRTALWWVTLAAGTGAAALGAGPGFEIELQLFRLSAHDPLPLLVVVLTALTAQLAWRRRLAVVRDLPAVLADLRRRAPLAADGIAVVLLLVAVAWNTWTIGGSDSHCYAAQARAFASGDTHLRQPLALAAPWPDATRTFAPVGFLPSPSVRGEFLPVCAPGYSLLVAPLVAVAPTLQFLVAPVASAILVCTAFVFTRRLCADPLAAVAASALCAAAPVVLFQSMQPMTDIPAAAALSAAAVLALERPPRAAAAGFALGLCLLIRPNLLPVVLPLLYWSRPCHMRLLAAATPLAILVPVLNTLVYGEPWKTGYGEADALFSLRHVPTNLWRYPSWLLETMTPVVVVGFVAPWLIRRATWPDSQRQYAVALLTLIAVVFGCYAAYRPFEDWWYLRFLLPSIPALCALTAAGVFAAMSRVRVPALSLLVVATVAAISFREAQQRRVFDLWQIEQRFPATADYVGRAIARPAVIAIMPNGAVSYGLRRPVVSWDSVRPEDLDLVIAWLREQGFHPLIVVDQHEEEQFRRRFSSSGATGALDWPPSAIVHRLVRVFDPAERARFVAGGVVSPTYVDPPRR